LTKQASQTRVPSLSVKSTLRLGSISAPHFPQRSVCASAISISYLQNGHASRDCASGKKVLLAGETPALPRAQDEEILRSAQEDKSKKSIPRGGCAAGRADFSLGPRSRRGRRIARQSVCDLAHHGRNKRLGRRRGFPYLFGRGPPCRLARPGGGTARQRRVG
jgi:hypothetical protein